MLRRIPIVGGVIGSAVRIDVDGIGWDTSYEWARIGGRSVGLEKAPVSLVEKVLVDYLQEVKEVG